MNDFLKSFRNLSDKSNSLAFGCSHTWGVGVESDETWPYILDARNFGINGASGDLVVRVAKEYIPKFCPDIVYCLWPDWGRFEYEKNGEIYQSLPTDANRIHLISTHDDQWCKNNFAKNVKDMKDLCKSYDTKLLHMTLYDLIPFIDHADKWPVSKLGHHYSPVWHRWVANIFSYARDNDQVFSLAYE